MKKYNEQEVWSLTYFIPYIIIDDIIQGLKTMNQVMKVCCILHMSRVTKKLVFRVSDQVQHKPRCTAIGNELRLEILDLGSRGIVLSM